MNAPFLLDEIALALDQLRTQGERRILYLSQFPLSEADVSYMQEFLGRGPATITLGGVNQTIWRESGTPGVWWGEYYEGPQKLLLRTIEIAEIPELAVTPRGDIDRGVEELRKKLPEAYAAQTGGDACGGSCQNTCGG
jgi:hydrogenase-1 operon protein HyaF